MNAEQVIRELGLKQIARNFWAGKCPLCNAGEDRFVVKMNVKGEYVWLCRKCEPNGYKTFYYLMHKLNGTWAYDNMNERKWQSLPKRSVDKSNEGTNIEWQIEAQRMVEEGVKNLHTPSQLGAIVREYLHSRGLIENTWKEFKLGAAVVNGKIVMTIPCFDAERIHYVKFRVVRPQDNGLRYFCMKESRTNVLYGLNALEGKETLMLVEGELNALSLWQVVREWLDVASFGSESFSQLGLLKALRKRYKQTILWLDNEERGRELLKALHAQRLIVSSAAGGDANELLQAGKLKYFLEVLLCSK